MLGDIEARAITEGPNRPSRGPRQAGTARGGRGTRSGLSPRSDWHVLLIGLALVIFIAPLTFQVAIVRMPIEVFFGFGVGAPAMVPLLVLLVLAAGSAFAGSASLAASFWSSTRYCSSGFRSPAAGCCFYLLPEVPWLHYMAALRPEYASTFLRYLPAWWGPRDPAVIDGFLYGGRIPWSAWIVPLAAWGSFALALWLSVTCLLALFQRQWIHHERLTFPVAQIPLEVLRETTPTPGRSGAAGGVGRVFLLGALLGFALTFVHSLSARIPGSSLSAARVRARAGRPVGTAGRSWRDPGRPPTAGHRAALPATG